MLTPPQKKLFLTELIKYKDVLHHKFQSSLDGKTQKDAVWKTIHDVLRANGFIGSMHQLRDYDYHNLRRSTMRKVERGDHVDSAKLTEIDNLLLSFLNKESPINQAGPSVGFNYEPFINIKQEEPYSESIFEQFKQEEDEETPVDGSSVAQHSLFHHQVLNDNRKRGYMDKEELICENLVKQNRKLDLECKKLRLEIRLLKSNCQKLDLSIDTDSD